MTPDEVQAEMAEARRLREEGVPWREVQTRMGISGSRLHRLLRGEVKGNTGAAIRYDHDYDVDPETGCWVWARSIGWDGYGRKWTQGQRGYAHRYYFEQAKGPVPDGLELDHLCRNRACCNPDHLEAVTRATNVQRGACRSKLTWDDVCEIRRRKAEGEATNALAREFGVSRGLVWGILNGRKWQQAPAGVALGPGADG